MDEQRINPHNVLKLLENMINDRFTREEFNGTDDIRIAKRLFIALLSSMETNGPANDAKDANWEISNESTSITAEKERNLYQYYINHGRQVKRTLGAYLWANDTILFNVIRKFENPKLTRNDKSKLLKEKLYERFKIERSKNNNVHDVNLKQWAISIAKEIDFQNFKASESYIYKFKVEYDICSRKIVEFTDKSTVKKEENLPIIIAEFYLKIRQLIPQFTNVYNFDQSPMTLNLYRNRTLSFKGERRTRGKVQAKNSMTHSYTVTHIISIKGNLCQKVHICLNENVPIDKKSGKRKELGKLIQKQYSFINSTYKNIFVDYTNSGKHQKDTLESFVNNALIPQIDDNSLILCDCFSSHKDPKLFTGKSKNFRVEFIPESTTKYLQPLDKLFNRQYKNFAKHINEYIMLNDVQFKMHTRFFICRLNSLITDQFCSPMFKSMIIMAFSNCNYIDDDMLYITPYKFCFGELSGQCNNCNNPSFIKCSHCITKEYCFKCWFGKNLSLDDFHCHFK